MNLPQGARGDAAQSASGAPGGVLVLSMRRISQLVAYCIEYEFEDVISRLTAAHVVEVDPVLLSNLSRRVYRYTRLLTGSRRFARIASLAQPALRVERDYELFLPIFNEAHELSILLAVPDWRKRCRFAACFVSELWLHRCPGYLLELLSDFDHVFVGVDYAIDDMARLIGRPCTYLPLAADVLRFAPHDPAAERPIDVCNVGRRSEATHAALLRRAANGDFFYYYDTVAASGVDLKQRTFRVQDPLQHRLLLANLLKRSRYFIANHAFINDPAFTMGHREISSRFYEGAAAGTVMIGTAPDTESFRRQFDWTDAVIHAPFDFPLIARFLDEIDADPQRVAAIRRANVRQAALRHDWLYRLQAVFDHAGIAQTGAMIERGRQLQQLAM